MYWIMYNLHLWGVWHHIGGGGWGEGETQDCPCFISKKWTNMTMSTTRKSSLVENSDSSCWLRIGRWLPCDIYIYIGQLLYHSNRYSAQSNGTCYLRALVIRHACTYRWTSNKQIKGRKSPIHLPTRFWLWSHKDNNFTLTKPKCVLIYGQIRGMILCILRLFKCV